MGAIENFTIISRENEEEYIGVCRVSRYRSIHFLYVDHVVHVYEFLRLAVGNLETLVSGKILFNLVGFISM